MRAGVTTARQQPVDGTVGAGGGARGHPWALTVLWVCLMTPLSLTGTALQPYSGVPYEVFPLVMLGPALAALICRIVAPRWFGVDRPRARAKEMGRSWIALGAASAVFVAVIVPFGGDRSMILPEGVPTAAAIVLVVAGLAAGSLCEEIGYRGVMFRALSARLRPMPAVAINGVFFGLCHLQYFGDGILPVVLFLIATVLLDVVMVAVWTGAWWQRVAVAAAFHAVVNMGMQLAGIGADRMLDFVGMSVALAAAAGVAVLLGRLLRVGEFTRPKQSTSTGSSSAGAPSSHG